MTSKTTDGEIHIVLTRCLKIYNGKCFPGEVQGNAKIILR